MTGPLPKKKANSKKLVHKSLRYSFWEGFFASIQFGIIEQFVVPLALFFGANNIGVGFLSFGRNALVSIVQIFSADLTALFRSRKRFLTSSVLLAALLWLPTYFLPFLFGDLKVHVFIILFSLTSCFNMVATPAWASLMSEYIPHRKRGEYFGFRGTALGIVYFVSLMAGGFVLQFLGKIDLFASFAVVILIASASRFISWFLLRGMHEPKWRAASADYFSFWDFIRRIRESNFARYAVLLGFFMLSVAMVSPFFAVYILQELGFDYLPYTLLMGATIFTTFVMQRYWGTFADRYGNLQIVRITTVLIAAVPVLWIFSKDFAYLVMIQLLAGFLWAGFNLASTNFIYDAAAAGKRERCLAYYNFLLGFGLGVGALIGGFLYQYLPPVLGSSFYVLLIISGILRLALALCVRYFVKEVRTVAPVRTRMLLMDISGVRALGVLGRELLYRLKS